MTPSAVWCSRDGNSRGAAGGRRATHLSPTIDSPCSPGMDRRRFLLTSVAGACAAPVVAAAQQSGGLRRIGVIAMQEDPAWQGFWEELRRFGWIEGRNITVERRFALGP